MKCLNDRFVIEPAKPTDADEILQLIEQTAFGGDISLLYTRRPDAYQSFLCEGKDAEIFVCRDSQKSKIIALGAYAIQDVYLNNKAERAAYIFGLKGHADYLKRYLLLHKFYGYLDARLKARHIMFCYTTILQANVHAQQLLERERKGMPRYRKFGRYDTFAIRQKSRKLTHPDLKFLKACKEDLQQIVEFLSKEGRNCQLFPTLTRKDILSEAYKGLGADNFYCVKKGDEVVAAGAIWDQRAYKQYIVHAYSGMAKILNKYSILSTIFQLPALPDPGQMLKFCTLSRWAVKNNDVVMFRFFLNNILREINDYPFLIVGMHESHPLRVQLQQWKHIRYSSNVYLVDWDKNWDSTTVLDSRIPTYIECGAL